MLRRVVSQPIRIEMRVTSDSEDVLPTFSIQQNLGFQLHAFHFQDPRPDAAHQFQHIGARGMPAIDDEIRVHRRNFGITHPFAL